MVLGERFAPRGVHPVIGSRERRAPANAIAPDGFMHEAYGIGFADRAGVEVPVSIERDRIDLVKLKMVKHERKGIGGEEIEPRLIERGFLTTHE